MRPPSACQPTVGASTPKGTCRWLSRHGGRVTMAALSYNFHRAAGRVLCRRLEYATGYCKWQSGLAATIHGDSALCRSSSSLPIQSKHFSAHLQRSDASRTTSVRGGMSQLEVFVTVECNAGDASNDERRRTYSGLPWWYHGIVLPRHRDTMPPRHHGTKAPWRHGTMAPWHQGTLAPRHHGSVAPWQRGTVAPWHRGTMAPRHCHGAMAPWHRGTKAQRHQGTKAPWHQGTVASWHHGTVAPRHHGTMTPWYHGTMAPWHHGTMAPWHRGTMAPRHCSTAPWNQGTVAPRHRGTVAPWHQRTVAIFLKFIHLPHRCILIFLHIRSNFLF
ncbi:hypothetical protein FXO37_25304 [Capsicum annuum]|nr:hypothetical protein FXO37_25304 [Capsicum annuum]